MIALDIKQFLLNSISLQAVGRILDKNILTYQGPRSVNVIISLQRGNRTIRSARNTVEDVDTIFLRKDCIVNAAECD